MNPLGAGGTCVTFRAGRSKVSLRSCGADISLRPSGADISGRSCLTNLPGVTLRAGRACVAFGAGRACGACLTGFPLVTLRPGWPGDRGAGFSLRASITFRPGRTCLSNVSFRTSRAGCPGISGGSFLTGRSLWACGAGHGWTGGALRASGPGRASRAGRASVAFRAGGACVTLRPGVSLCSGGTLCARLTFRAGLSDGARGAGGAFRALDAAGVHPCAGVRVPPVQMRTDQIGVPVLSGGVSLLKLFQSVILPLPGNWVSLIAFQAGKPLVFRANKPPFDGDLIGGDVVASPGPGIWNVTQSNPSSQASAGLQVCAYQRMNSE